jgi:hypothetical protein
MFSSIKFAYYYLSKIIPMRSNHDITCLDDPVKIEESLMILTTRALRGEVAAIEDPGWTEENPFLQKFPDNIISLPA